MSSSPYGFSMLWNKEKSNFQGNWSYDEYLNMGSVKQQEVTAEKWLSLEHHWPLVAGQYNCMPCLNLVYQKYCIHVNLIKQQQQPYNPNDEHTFYQTEKNIFILRVRMTAI